MKVSRRFHLHQIRDVSSHQRRDVFSLFEVSGSDLQMEAVTLVLEHTPHQRPAWLKPEPLAPPGPAGTRKPGSAVILTVQELQGRPDLGLEPRSASDRDL